MSKVYSLKTVQQLPVTLAEAWNFFTHPDNLKIITPSNLGFRIISKYQFEHIYAGQLIEYKVRPLFRIPFYWMTEITHVSAMEYFVDEQRYGPYSLWHHQHHFTPIEGGVKMTDIIHYKLPLPLFAAAANKFFVRKKLHEIFKFRYIKAGEILGDWDGSKIEIEFA